MTFVVTPYAIASAVAAVVALIVAAVAYPRRASPGGRSLTALMLAAAIWSAFTALEYAAVGIPGKVFWAKLEYLGVVSAPVFFLLLALEYHGSEHWLSRRKLGLVAVIPLITQSLALTNEAHGLIWSSFTPALAGQNLLIYGHGPWYYVGVVGYSSLLMLIGTLLLIRAALSYPNIYRSQATALIFGALVPWLGSVLYALNISLWPGYDPASLLLAFTGALFAWGIFRFRLLNLAPVARHTVIESMRDAMVVIDDRDRIVDLNRAAQHLIGPSATTLIGQPLAQVWRAWHIPLDTLRDQNQTHIELNLPGQHEARQYEAQLSPLADGRGNLTGRVIVLHDVTERQQAEAARWASEQRYRMLADNASDVIWILDVEQEFFSYASPSLPRLVGYTALERLNQSLEQTVTPASLAYLRAVIPERVERMLHGHTEPYTDEVELIHRDGQRVIAESTTRFLVNPATSRIECIGVSRDITERKRAEEALRQVNLALAHTQAQMIEQQRAVAVLEEREHLARELHDNLGQVLGFVNLQAQAVRQFLAEGDHAQADVRLARLAAITQESQAQLRDTIARLKSAAPIERQFFPGLTALLDKARRDYDLRITLDSAPTVEERGFAPEVGAQLLNIIQEALTNIGRHAGAMSVAITLVEQADRAEISIVDDGRGFDPRQPIDDHAHFGLRFMRERAQHVGGDLSIQARPGDGTRVSVQMPLRPIEAGVTP
ncbi:MAG: PAS domain S-box protein [Thermoflexales bacterium]|nr:PAS domain S-box protein [Thermoflexales bacterium]